MSTGNLLFQPWVGKQYGEGSIFGIPVLIVGESNYGVSEGADQDATFTHRLIESIINARWKHNFFSNIQRSFVEDADTEELRARFWHSVAHHEYIQDWLSKPGVSPSEEMWTKAKPLFSDVVAELKPKCILFVCKRVYGRLSVQFPSSTPLILNGDYPETLTIYKNPHPTLQVDHALASYINHPTSPHGGFRRARGVVNSLLKTAGGKAWI